MQLLCGNNGQKISPRRHSHINFSISARRVFVNTVLYMTNLKIELTLTAMEAAMQTVIPPCDNVFYLDIEIKYWSVQQ